MRWLAASIVSACCFCFAALGTFVPLRDEAGIQYAFIWPGALPLLAGTAAAALALSLLYASSVRTARRRAPERLDEARRGRWLAPVTALGLCIFGILPAAPGAGEVAASIGYFLFDLRWWWLGAVVLWLAASADRFTGGHLERWIRGIGTWRPRVRLLFFDTVLFLAVVASAIGSTRHLRFDPGLHGDEPKYIRYAETWYQGRGFEVSGNRPVRELLPDRRSRVLHNLTLFVHAIGEESRTLVADVRAFLQDPRGFRWNRAQRHEGFVTGKRGGLYQIYMPGVSYLLFPGYFIDRRLLTDRASEAGEFPADLVMTNLSMLVLYALSAVALFRLFRRALASEPLALGWAAVAALTFPTAAFAFQFYPEIPALLVIVLVANYVWFHADSAGPVSAAAAGLGAGGLAWFHPRFLLVSLVLLLAGAARTVTARSRIAFLASAAAAVVSVMAFAYRVTGSFLPTALWEAPGSEPSLNLFAAPITVLGYALDRTWGMVPHTPLLLAAVPGLAVLARHSSKPALFVLVLGLSLAVPAAAHTLSAAGTTPGRLIVAVVPLFMLPVAVLVRRFWSSYALRASFGVALVVSLETAFTYNWHHIKIMGSIRSAGASGWRPNLAFPVVSGGGWTDFPVNVALFVVVVGLLCALTVAAFVRAKLPSSPSGMHGRRQVAAAGALAAILLAAPAATAFNRRWTYGDYLMADAEARRTAAAALVSAEDCRLCFSTGDRAIDWRWLRPNAADGLEIATSARARTATLQVTLTGAEGPLRFGRIRAEFGDGSSMPWTGIVDTGEIAHTYREPGRYAVVVWLQLRNGEMRAARAGLTVAAPSQSE